MESRQEQQLDEMAAVIEASAAVISELDISQVLQAVMDRAKEIVRSEASSLLLLNDTGEYLEFQVALGSKAHQLGKVPSLKVGQGIAGWVAKTGQPLLIADVDQDPRFFRGTDELTGFKTQSVLCVPMKVKGVVIGVIEVMNPRDKDAFSESDLKVLDIFSSLASIAVENARLIKALTEQEAVNRELKFAHEIQSRLLVHDFLRTPRWAFYAKTQAAREIGGDFYDLLQTDDRSIASVIGDVSGKGISAALYMVQILNQFRMAVLRSGDGVSVVEGLNRWMTHQAAFGMFVTASFFWLEEALPCVRVVNAGHLPSCIYRKESHSIEKCLGRSGLPLGIDSEGHYQTERWTLKSGDRIILITDGVIEARNNRGEEWGGDRLEKFIMEKMPRSSSQELVDSIFHELDRFRGPFAFADDVTVMAAECLDG